MKWKSDRSVGVATVVGLSVCIAVVSPSVATEELEGPSITVESFHLGNGMEFLLVQQPSSAVVAAGWVAHVGSVNEEPGTTGLSHMLEHMMFKGSETMGARDLEAEQKNLRQQSRVEDRLVKAYGRQRRGASGSASNSPEIQKLEQQLTALEQEGALYGRQGELDVIYATNGATDVNAFTIQDMTLYLASMPEEKLELWFWLESDRLLNPIFRGFFNEKSVIRQERGLRIDSTPTGRVENEIRAAFWGSHPYSWPTIGVAEDLSVLRRVDAEAFYERHYPPANLTAVLVGSLDVERTRRLAEKYFGRLKAGRRPRPVSVPVRQLEKEKRVSGRCDCRPQIQVLYPGVAFAHEDSYALSVLAGVMNGRTGRLYRSLVLEQEIAFAAYTRVHAMRWAGYFVVMAEGKEGAGPEDLLAGWDEELERLIQNGIPPEELQKVQNQIRADAYRRLREPDELRTQLMLYAGLGNWESLNSGPIQVARVTAEDVIRVARTYLKQERRAVGLFEPTTTASPAESP